jgi:GAF domain-containing protein
VSYEPQLSEVFARAAREIHEAPGMDETLDAIVRSACESLPEIDHVGITIGHKDGHVETVAATDELVLTFDKMQYDVGEGPCLYAMEAETIIRVEHARHEQRWPGFIPQAVAAGLQAMLGVRLHVDASQLAALNMYSTTSDTLDPDLESFSELFASYASLALGHVRREDQLTKALISRRLIGQATGIVMERYGVSEERAFRYLTRVSNDTNVKLRDLAAQVVDEANAKDTNGTGG